MNTSIYEAGTPPLTDTGMPISVPLGERVFVRFGATLLSNIVRAALSFGAGVLIARGLGAVAYGNLNFLIGSFLSIIGLIAMSSHEAFYTFIAKKRRNILFFSLYISWLLFQFGFVSLFVAYLLPRSALNYIWVGHPKRLVLLAFAAAFFSNQVWGMLTHLGEARRQTVKVQMISIFQDVLHLTLIIYCIWAKHLNINVVLWLLTLEYVFLACCFGPSLIRLNLDPLDPSTTQSITKEFIVFCKPLMLSTWVGFLYTFADRWLLQHYRGPLQQGFLTVSQQFANVGLVLTMAIFLILWKEMAEAFEKNEMSRLQRLCDYTTHTLYFLVGWLACALIPYSKEILLKSVGQGYTSASLCLMIMLLYPVHQSLAHIYSALFMVSGQTKTFASIATTMMLSSIVASFLILKFRFGFMKLDSFGSVGLAVKMVVFQIFWVNWYGLAIHKKLGWTYRYFYQICALFLLATLGWLTKGMSLFFLNSIHHPNFAGTILMGVFLYSVSTFTILTQWPDALGLTRQERDDAYGFLKRFVELKKQFQKGATPP